MAITIESESSFTRMVNESSLPMVFKTFDMLNDRWLFSSFTSVVLPDKTDAQAHISIASIGFKAFASHDQ